MPELARVFRRTSLLFIAATVGLFALVLDTFAQSIVALELLNEANYRGLDTVGRPLKFQRAGDRLVVFDYENHRVLLYDAPAGLATSEPIATIGQIFRTKNDAPYDPVANDPLNESFAGTLYDGRLWISNTTFGELLTFDLDGNYLSTTPGTWTQLDVEGSDLYAFEDSSIFRYDESTGDFDLVGTIPGLDYLSSPAYGANVEVGSDRLVVYNRYSEPSIRVYDLSGFLDGTQTSPLFTRSEGSLAEFEILPDRIVWALQSGAGTYSQCDLDGNDLGGGAFGAWTYNLDFSNGQLYYVSPGPLKVFDPQLAESESFYRLPFYWAGQFKGADAQHLYFYDLSNGGFVVVPYDVGLGVYTWDPANEIPYSGWHREMRTFGSRCYLLSEHVPPASPTLEVFDIPSMTGVSVDIDPAQSLAVTGDGIFLISGTTIRVHDLDGNAVGDITLHDLSGSNLELVDDQSFLRLAADESHFYVWHEDKLNVLDATGGFQAMHDMACSYPDAMQLFAVPGQVQCTRPLETLLVDSGVIVPLFESSADVHGFFDEYDYWFASGHNTFTRITRTWTGLEEAPSEVSILRGVGPTPFQTRTSVHLDLDRSRNVRVSVFDLAGRRVDVLMDEILSPGRHSIPWSGRDSRGRSVAAGTYLIRLDAEGIVSTSKVVLLH